MNTIKCTIWKIRNGLYRITVNESTICTGGNNMEPHKIANILFYMSLDMDYADALESANEEIDCIARDLEFLKQNGRDVILQALEMIAMENESIPEKWNNKGYKRTLS